MAVFCAGIYLPLPKTYFSPSVSIIYGRTIEAMDGKLAKG